MGMMGGGGEKSDLRVLGGDGSCDLVNRGIVPALRSMSIMSLDRWLLGALQPT